ncbi:MAG: hypothetical protein H6766_05415 [Candidatus Peribacteria bacterium]|nr:MAG: hypothetical protein H6766_05415 [Candidatus Peribacteria bacterium]
MPRQILAYSSFTKRDRTQSLVYLQELIERDPDNSEFYTFLRGIVIYRQGDYAAAALTLRQTQNPRYLPDAVRYLALAYDHLDDITQRDQAFTALLQYSLDPSDYYTYFYLTFFQPFQEGDFQTQSIVLDTTTAQEYVRRCTESLSGDARIVCEYGAA